MLVGIGAFSQSPIRREIGPLGRPKKHFGQHFLHDRAVVDRIIAAIAPRANDSLVEIGPGEGVLTLPLLRAAGRLTAIELDRDLIEPLRKRATGLGTLELVQADVLTVNLAKLAPRNTKLRVVGNLPYYISSPILFHCLRHADVIEDMHFMLQHEVVARMAAEPGGKDYGRLSVMLQLACSVEPLLQVPPGAFRPPPKVESAVVRLRPLAGSVMPEASRTALDEVVRAAFGQRRKTLANALQGVLDVDAIRACDIDPRLRAERLAPADFVRLAEAASIRRRE